MPLDGDKDFFLIPSRHLLYTDLVMKQLLPVEHAISALSAAASTNNRKVINVTCAIVTEQSDLTCLDALRNTAVVSAASFTAPVLDAYFGVALGFGIHIDIPEGNLSTGWS